VNRLQLGFILIAVAVILGSAGLTYSDRRSNQGFGPWLRSGHVFPITRTISCFDHRSGNGPEFELCKEFWESQHRTDVIRDQRYLRLFSIPASIYFPAVLAVALAGIGLVIHAVWASSERRT